MYHNSHQFGKAYQEELLRVAGVKDEQEFGGRIQEQKLQGGIVVRRKMVRPSSPTSNPDSGGSLKGSRGRLLGGIGALSSLVILALFLALVAARIM